MVDRPQYATPTRILARSKENHRPVISQVVASTPPTLVPNEGTLEVEPNVTVEGPSLVGTEEKPEAEEPIRALPSDDSSLIEAAVQDRTDTTPAETPMEPEPPETEPPDPPQGDPVCYHEGGELFAEDVESHMAVLPGGRHHSRGADDRRYPSRQPGRQQSGGDRETATSYLETLPTVDGEG
ncbi:hypothetical protein PF003_g28345 [Phytophthora fragariae]|nr:hypothetical protein PF003_g28345 [Phytophthora fragariae]